MRYYELIYIVNSNVERKKVDQVMKDIGERLEKAGSKLINHTVWGKKKLAYPIENKKSGFYHLFEFAASSDAVPALEVEFRRDERVMRYLTVKLDKHGQAWAEKRKKRIKAKS